MSPTEDSEVGKKILSRFSAQFARQLSTKLRITKDNLVLQEKVGSGMTKTVAHPNIRFCCWKVL